MFKFLFCKKSYNQGPVLSIRAPDLGVLFFLNAQFLPDFPRTVLKGREPGKGWLCQAHKHYQELFSLQLFHVWHKWSLSRLCSAAAEPRHVCAARVLLLLFPALPEWDKRIGFYFITDSASLVKYLPEINVISEIKKEFSINHIPNAETTLASSLIQFSK